jgi:P4 family phage/plasmid primase-like protien
MDLQIYQKLGFKLFLCNENKQAMVEWKDPKNHLTVEEAQKYQQEEGFLIGAWIPPSVKVIDLDRHEGKPDGFEQFAKIAKQYKFSIEDILKKTFCVKTAGKGLHLYFLDSETRKKDVAPGIEDRGSNLYVIAAGSKGYVPVNGVTDLIEFPEGMKAWLKDADDPPKKKKKAKKTAPPVEILAEVLTEVDVFNFGTNERWFQFIASCIAVFGETDEVYDLLEQWSRNDPKYARDATIRKRIESVKADKDNGIGIGTFIMLLEEEEVSADLLKKLRRILDQGDPSTALALTDVGNGYVFIQDHGDIVRYCTKLDDGRGGGWLYYNGKRWIRDHQQVIPGLAKQTVKRLYDFAFETSDKALSKHALKSASNGRIYAMLTQARSVAGIPVDPKEFDIDPWLLNVQNGTIDLRLGVLLAYSKENLLTKICNVEYDEKAECPRWKQFIDEIMNGDKEMEVFLQKLMGYCLTGDMREDMFFFLWGSGCNGKTVFAETIIWILGDYACTAMEETFMAKPPGKINADLERIADKRLIFTSELNKGAKLDESLIKRWTGEDTISVEQKFQIPYDTKPIGKLLFRTNSKPEIEGQDEGIWRRTKLVPFTVSFKDREDKQLKSKLLKEASGVLNWLLEGCRLWQKEGLDLPPQVKEASADYRTEQDSLNDFFTQYLEKGDATYTITKARCYKLYKEYVESWGEKPLAINKLSQKLADYPGIREGRETTGGRTRLWFGIRERTDEAYKKTREIL